MTHEEMFPDTACDIYFILFSKYIAIKLSTTAVMLSIKTSIPSPYLEPFAHAQESAVLSILLAGLKTLHFLHNPLSNRA